MLQTVIHAWMNAGISNRSTVQIKSPGTIYSGRPKPTVKNSRTMEKRRNFHPSNYWLQNTNAIKLSIKRVILTFGIGE